MSTDDAIAALAFQAEMAGHCLIVYLRDRDQKAMDNAIAHARQGLRRMEELDAELAALGVNDEKGGAPTVLTVQLVEARIPAPGEAVGVLLNRRVRVGQVVDVGRADDGRTVVVRLAVDGETVEAILVAPVNDKAPRPSPEAETGETQRGTS